MGAEKQLVNEILVELKNSVELFYQQKTKEALDKFESILGRMAELVDTLFAYRENHEEFLVDEEKIKETLTEAMNALEDRDMILLADIIQYDFIEYIEELAETME